MGLSKNSKLEKIANILCLSYDDRIDVAHDIRDGYEMILKYGYNSSTKYTLSFSLSKNGWVPIQQEVEEVMVNNKAISSCNVEGNLVIYEVDTTKDVHKASEILGEALNSIISFFKMNGYRNSCSHCGIIDAEINIYNVKGYQTILCEKCFNETSTSNYYDARKGKYENSIGGLIGAFLGSLIGVAVILIFGRLDSISYISGFMMAVCTLKGYEILGKRLSIKGIIISIMIMMVMIYLAARLDAAIDLSMYLEDDIFSIFRAIPELVRLEIIDSDIYYMNMVQIYLFSFIGISIPFVSLWKSNSEANNSYKVS